MNKEERREYMVKWRKKNKERIANYEREFYRTKDGLVTQLHKSQRSSSKKRNHPKPNYTRNELSVWLFGQELFHKLYSDWVESGYDKMKKPSVDRIDNTKYYSMDNINLVTWEENYNKRNNGEMPSGDNHYATKNKEHYSTNHSLRNTFKETCKRKGWDFHSFTEVCSEEKDRYYYR